MMAITDQDKQIYHNGRTYAEHCAWLDSLVGDEFRIVHMPIWHLFGLVLVSGFKRVLLTQQTTLSQRIKFLDGIAQSVFGCVTLDAVAAIEPCCETGEKILLEIFSIPSVGEQYQAFIKGNVSRLLAKLNPSLLTALRLCALGPIPEQPRVRTLELIE